MTIARVKSAGWGSNETLTSAQATQVDINAASCLDKRSGQTDTLNSTVTVSQVMTFQNGITVSGASQMAATAWFGLATFHNGVTIDTGSALTAVAATFSGLVTCNLGLTANGVVTVNSTLSVSGASMFAGGFTVNGGSSLFQTSTSFTGGGNNFLVSQATFLNGPLTSGSTWTLTGPVTCSNLILSGSSVVTYTVARSITRTLSTVIRDDGWLYLPNGTLTVNAASAVTGSVMSYCIDEIPDGATLDSMSVVFKPPTLHMGLIQFPPTLFLYQIVSSTGATSLVASITDNKQAGGLSFYEAQHTLTLTIGGGIVIDRNSNRYILSFFSESGTNALNGTNLLSGAISFTTTSMDQF